MGRDTVTNWEDISISNPADLRILAAKIKKGGCEITVPYPYLNDDVPVKVIIPSIPGFPVPSLVQPLQRELIVVNYLAEPSIPKYKALYSFMEMAGVAVTQHQFAGAYQQIRVLESNNASF